MSADGGGAPLALLVSQALASLEAGREQRGGPVPAASPAEVARSVDEALGHAALPEHGVGDEAALADLVTVVSAGAADPTDPACSGHLHCPPLDVAVAADLAASALNQSLDSWDQAPAATVLEERVVAALGDLAGLPGAAGVLTTGGTGSTYTALLLARDAAPGPVRVLASELAHFSADRGAHLLGLGGVTQVACDDRQRLDVAALARALASLPAGTRPVVVATAGTTDFGSIDPLAEVAGLVRAHGGWLHVDAAYGGGLLFSDRHRHLLAGLELADTVSLDLHKLGWQPAAAGVLLTRDPALFGPLARRAAYLNPLDDEEEGYTSLLGRSLRTTRRADVLKVAVTLRARGRRGLGDLVDACLERARAAAAAVAARPELELLAEPALSTVVFRHRGADGSTAAGDLLNARLRRALLAAGDAVVGRTEHEGRVWLKLTLLNPAATDDDVARVLDRVVEAGRAEAAALRAERHARDVLVRCWLRETGQAPTGPGPLTVPLPATGGHVQVEVTAVSPTGAHALGAVRDAAGAELGQAALADLLTREAAARTGRGDHRGACDRVRESARRATAYAASRAREQAPPALPGWLLAEQELIAGHPWHPMTKSRDGLADELDAQYAPEARGSFAVHWLAAAPEVVAHGGAGLDVVACTRQLAGAAAAGLPDGWVLVPAHPWQAASLAARPAAADLLGRGLLRDLGPHGDLWWATSSLRTVARPGTPVMLKLSLGLRVTNSRRENTRDEGRLAVHTARLVDAGLGRALTAAHPAFGLVLDRGWIGVDHPDHLDTPGAGGVGLETVLREVPFDASADVRCAGALLDPRPDLPRPPLAALVERTAATHGLPSDAAAERWLRAWLDTVVEPLLWLHGAWGVGLEAHLQNVLVALGPDGAPAGGWYRDNQGWYAAASAVPRLAGLLPEVGHEAPLVFDDDLVTDRVAYYLGVNHLLGLVAALAAATGTPEERLLAVVAGALRRHLAGPAPSAVADLLLHAERLPAKANLLTAVDGRDEVTSPVARQSLYVDLPNPVPAHAVHLPGGVRS